MNMTTKTLLAATAVSLVSLWSCSDKVQDRFGELNVEDPILRAATLAGTSSARSSSTLRPLMSRLWKALIIISL